VTKHFLDPENLFRWHRSDLQKVTLTLVKCTT